MTITIYTDGSCNNRSDLKVGGYSCILLYPNKKQVILHGGEFHSTSARMELIAVKSALEFLVKTHEDEDISVELLSDAQYIVHSINKGWLWGWVKNNYISTKNSDLWKNIIVLLSHSCLKSLNIRHVKGHSGIEYNEKADFWADFAVKKMIQINSENPNKIQYSHFEMQIN